MLWAVDSPVEEVSMYSSARCVPEFPSEDCYILIMKFANGVLGKCHVTSGCSGPTWHGFFESYGLTGTLKEGSLYRRDQEPVELEDTSTGNVVGGHGWAGSRRRLPRPAGGQGRKPHHLQGRRQQRSRLRSRPDLGAHGPVGKSGLVLLACVSPGRSAARFAARVP